LATMSAKTCAISVDFSARRAMMLDLRNHNFSYAGSNPTPPHSEQAVASAVRPLPQF
jgi:hypothetical protein